MTVVVKDKMEAAHITHRSTIELLDTRPNFSLCTISVHHISIAELSDFPAVNDCGATSLSILCL
jgi:hypothetical protein